MTTTDEIGTYFGAIQDTRAGEYLGPSSSTKCFRAAAYAYHGTPPTDEVSTDAADLGSLLHLGWSQMIGNSFPIHERECDVVVDIPGMPRSGTADDVDWMNHTVTDLKTANGMSWQRMVNQDKPYESWWNQLNLYALGLASMTGEDPWIWTCRVVCINRDTGARAEWTRPADPIAAKVLAEQITERHEALLASVEAAKSDEPCVCGTEFTCMASHSSPEDFPREGNGPGSGMPCDWCPWLSQCWPTPDTDTPWATAQSASVGQDTTAIQTWADVYLQASIAEGKARMERRNAAQYLAEASGEYGQFKVTQVGGNSKGEIPDVEEMITMLKEREVEIPMMDGGTTPRYVKVSRLPQKK